MDQNTLDKLAARVEALELAHHGNAPHTFSIIESSIAVLSALGGVVCAYLGLGIPNHPYQIAIGTGLILIAYHSRRLRRPSTKLDWLLSLLNICLLILLSKLVIGGGVRHPFFWLHFPSLEFGVSKEPWLSFLPKTALIWKPSEMAAWTVDLTVVQSFLAVICVFTTAVRFQPFASLCGLLLLVLSLTNLIEFEWRWVFPALLLTATSFYLQLFSHASQVGEQCG